jgi:hypothetical protein
MICLIFDDNWDRFRSYFQALAMGYGKKWENVMGKTLQIV